MKAEYVDHMGTDLTVVNAAKVSFDKRSTEMGKAECSLINYLARGVPEKEWEANLFALASMHDISDINKFVREIRNAATHWAPFAHPQIQLRMEAPSRAPRDFCLAEPQLTAPVAQAARKLRCGQWHRNHAFQLAISLLICNLCGTFLSR